MGLLENGKIEIKEDQTVRFKDVWSNVLLAGANIGPSARKKIDEILPLTQRSGASAAELNGYWDEILKLINEDKGD